MSKSTLLLILITSAVTSASADMGFGGIIKDMMDVPKEVMTSTTDSMKDIKDSMKDSITDIKDSAIDKKDDKDSNTTK